MPNHAFYFFKVDRELPITDYERINASLREQKAPLRYGPAFDDEGRAIWELDFNRNPAGIYRKKEDFSDPLKARISLAEAYQREREARSNHPIFSPCEPRLPGE